AGATITVLGATTATPSFTAPRLPTPVDITFTLTVRGALGQVSTDTVVIHVGAVPGTITIANGRYIVNKNNWRIDGSATPPGGQTIPLFLGPVGSTARPIGTAVVAGGVWSLQTAVGSGPAPAAETTIWASGPNAASNAFTFQRN